MGLTIQEGDVLPFSDGGIAVHTGQKLLGQGRGLDAFVTHAGVVTRGGDAVSPALPFADIGVTHAVAKDIAQDARATIIETSQHSATIRRPPASLASKAREAAAIARRWATAVQMPRMTFWTRKAVIAGFGSGSFGAHARNRAAEYHQHKDRVGGPPSLHDATLRNEAVFGSMFVVAVDRAALGRQVSASIMNIDACDCTPMKLADSLRAKGFEHFGRVFELSTSAVIHVADRRGDLVPDHAPAFT